jgi:hypothetical protein
MNAVTSRRNFIKALGSAAIALPFYDLLGGRQAQAACGRCERIIFMYHPDGVITENWHATQNGSSFTLASSLSPLEPYKSKLALFRGLEMRGGDGNSHPKGAQRTLTGSPMGSNKSLDRHLADTVGANSAFRHIHLGVQATKATDDTSMVTYYGAGQPKQPQDNPLTAWNDLFGKLTPQNGSESTKTQSIIDTAKADLNDLRGALGTTEKSKLDLHLEALRQAEKRLSLDFGSCSVSRAHELQKNIHDDDYVPELMRMQIDNMVQAMACGLSKVGTIQLSRHTSNMRMNFDETYGMNDNYSHGASHNSATVFSLMKKWYNKQIAYLLGELAKRPDPVCGGNMLDNTLVYVFTEVRSGPQHQHDDMPFYVAGGGSGATKTGLVFNYTSMPHTNLLVSLARAMGNNINNYGEDSWGPLPGYMNI